MSDDKTFGMPGMQHPMPEFPRGTQTGLPPTEGARPVTPADKVSEMLKVIGQAGANAAGGAAMQMGLRKEDPNTSGIVARALVKAAAAFAKVGSVTADEFRAAADSEMGADAQAARRAIGARALQILRDLLAAERVEDQDEANLRRQVLGEQALALVRDADLLDGTKMADPPERREVEDVWYRRHDVCGARDGKGATCSLPDKHEGDHADGPITWAQGAR